MTIYVIITSLFLLVSSTECFIGLDSVNTVSVQNFTCLLKDGYEFYIGRIYKSMGEVDTISMQNIKNARKAGFKFVDGYIFPCLLISCKSAKEQIEEALNFVKNEGGQIGRLWISVIGRDLYWEFTHAFNQAFILEAVKQIETMGFKVGIFTNSDHWEKIVGNDWNAVAAKPLWLDNSSGRKNLENFVPFGGWKIPGMQIFNPQYKSPCGVVINENWFP